jgi:hypothetical protein
MKASLLHYRKKELSDGSIIEMVIWLVPKSGERPHGLKYRLHFGSPVGKCFVRYDNETGKGDHKHVGTTEERYRFTSVEGLIQDFENDVSAWQQKGG